MGAPSLLGTAFSVDWKYHSYLVTARHVTLNPNSGNSELDKVYIPIKGTPCPVSALVDREFFSSNYAESGQANFDFTLLRLGDKDSTDLTAFTKPEFISNFTEIKGHASALGFPTSKTRAIKREWRFKSKPYVITGKPRHPTETNQIFEIHLPSGEFRSHRGKRVRYPRLSGMSGGPVIAPILRIVKAEVPVLAGMAVQKSAKGDAIVCIGARSIQSAIEKVDSGALG